MESLEIMRKVDSTFWKGKRVLLTGHTGFKGSWMSMWLYSMGAEVKGLALEPPTEPSLFNIANVKSLLHSEIGDIRSLDTVKNAIHSFAPQIVIHLAAQPLVRYSYQEPIETYQTNVMGTAHVLEACREVKSVKSIVCVTTDKCYENKEWEWGYRENDAMGGHDPYSSSKGACELVIAGYRKSFFSGTNPPGVASARAGNVVGGGDWAEDRLIPDILRSFESGEKVIIRNPLATRPWQHVLEPLSGYLILAEELYKHGSQYAGGWNFGPKDEDCKSVEWMINSLIKKWPEKASWQLDENANPHEAKFLKLDCSKASFYLDWQPKWDIEYTTQSIVDWYLAWKANKSMLEYSLNEIKKYNE